MNETMSVCVVTHPITNASEAAVDGLLEVISAVAAVSLVTANLPSDSDIRETYNFTEITDENMGDSVVIAAIRFILNQYRMCKVLYKNEDDLVLFFGATSYVVPILFARMLGKGVILEPRGNVPDSLYRIWADRMPDFIAYLLSRPVWLLERIGYLSADAILTLSPSMADDLQLGKYEEKLYQEGARPVDIDRFSPTVLYEERDDRAGYLGRLDEEKGVDILTDAVKILSDDITFSFIGDGSLRSHIENELGNKIEEGTVDMSGWVDHDDVPDYLNELRLLVMTSRTEGVPTTILEAMACGTPVCATPVGGVPDVVTDGETGFIIEADEPADIAEQIESILKEENLEAMSHLAREFVVNNYSFNVVVERYKEVFEDVSHKRQIK